MKPALIVAVAILVGLVTLMTRPNVNAQNSESKKRIDVDEIGALSSPCRPPRCTPWRKDGDIGYWHFPNTPQPKDDSLRFSVTEVNGNKLKEPIEFNHAQIDVTDSQHRTVMPDFRHHPELENQAWTLTAYETGRIQLAPDEHQSKSPVFPIAGMPYYTRPFTSQIVAVLKSRDGRIKP